MSVLYGCLSVGPRAEHPHNSGDIDPLGLGQGIPPHLKLLGVLYRPFHIWNYNLYGMFREARALISPS